MRRLLTHLLTLGLVACAPVGYQRAPGPPLAEDAATSSPGPVLVVVVDGLRRDVLAAHLAAIRAADDAPEWLSGLALLGDAGFKRILAERAEAPAPAVGLAPLATLATGRFAGDHGVAGSRVLAAGPAGRLRRFDFRAARDASHVYHGHAFEVPQPDQPPVLASVLDTATLDSALAGQRRAVTVFDPFGFGSEWWIPRSDGAGINAILPHRVGGAAAPLFDRGARAAAIDAVRGKSAPDVLRLYFRQVLTESTLQTARRCEAPELSVVDRQGEALKAVDEHLWRLLRTWRAAHPRQFKALTVILVSTGGVSDRPTGVAPMTVEALLSQLASRAGAPCAERLERAAAEGALRLEGEGSAAFVAIRSAPLGQTAAGAALRQCLGTALKAATQGAAPLLGAAAHLDAGGVPQVTLAQGPQDSLSPGRRQRLEAQLAHAIFGSSGRLAAVAVLARGAVFSDPGGGPLGARGGLSQGAREVALLVASRAISPTAERALRTAPIELTDLAPTVLALQGLPTDGFPRPPFLIRGAGGLGVPRADRVLVNPAPAVEAVSIRPTDDGLTARYSEPATLWPPDDFVVRWAGKRWAWDPDSGKFPEDAPCQYSEAPDVRAWQCTLGLPEAPGAYAGGLWRRPAPTDDAAEDSADGRSFTAMVGDGSPTLAAVTECVDDEGLVLDLKAEDPVGLDRVVVLLADGHGAGDAGDQPGTALVEVALGSPKPGECGPDTPRCDAPAAVTQPPASLRVPFAAALVRHHRRANKLFAAVPADREALQARWTEAGGQGEPPRAGFLAVRVCNRAGRCRQQPLMTLMEWERRRAEGCP
ncbi:MAG: alkaline phosphatase family protein [Myxococcales bacterium]|nr:alkaline phosphatase family protein [Myxococcales bacterium]